MRAGTRARRRSNVSARSNPAAAAIAEEHQRIATAKEAAEAEVEASKPAEERKAVAPFKIGWVRSLATRPLNGLFYGEYGHGKTTLITSAMDVPTMLDVLFIDAESGDMSITSRRSLDVVKVRKYDDIARVFEYLVRHCVWRDENKIDKLLEMERLLKSDIVPLIEQTPPVDPNRTWFEEQRIRTGKPMDEPYLYRTVCIDTLSEVHKYLIYKFTGVEIGKTKISDDIEKMEEWPQAQELFRLFIRSFRDLPMNVLMACAHEIEPDRIPVSKSEGGGTRKNPLAGKALPKLPGKAAMEVAGFLDLVGYLVKEEAEQEGEKPQRYLYLGAGYEGWISKHRFENLPDLEYVTNPTMSSLIDLARKDAEADGTSQTSGAEEVEQQPTRRTRSAAANSRRRTSTTTSEGRGPGRGSGDSVRRRRGS